MTSQTTRPRIGVIGGGHLGRIHAKLAAAQSHCELVGVADPSSDSRSLVESQLNVPTVSDYRQWVGAIDGAIIAAPTFLHYEIGSWCLSQGIHALIEKPIASSLQEANELVQLAKAHKCTLQVGHVERFNPAWLQVQPQRAAQSVRFIEAAREGTYTGRSIDIGIVMDLMIHDIDLVLNAIHSPVDRVHAYGWSVLGEHEDFATACLQFQNGAIAQLRASRISPVAKRQMQVYTEEGLIEIDFGSGVITRTTPHLDVADGSRQADQLPPELRAKVKDVLFTDWLSRLETKAVPSNAIESEQKEFCNAIQGSGQVTVTGELGYQALEVATRILDQIALNRPSRGIIPAAAMFGNTRAA
jgi:predicted dehydrogenase